MNTNTLWRWTFLLWVCLPITVSFSSYADVNFAVWIAQGAEMLVYVNAVFAGIWIAIAGTETLAQRQEARKARLRGAPNLSQTYRSARSEFFRNRHRYSKDAERDKNA